MKPVIDNFSANAANYANYRPSSPDALFEWLYAKTKGRTAAWDCGTGNGQVAVHIAEHFDTVFATDISKEQLSHAEQRPNIRYLNERSESTSLPDKSVDLITIAQAIHWFDLDAFYKEVRRVAKPGAFFAAWTYVVLRINPGVDAVVDDLYNGETRAYWDAARDMVDARYQTIPFPFKEVTPPEFTIRKDFTIDQLVGYIGTWSGLNNYRKQTGIDPLPAFRARIAVVWGDQPTLPVTWPMAVRAGYVE